jgi:hypothetical protein
MVEVYKCPGDRGPEDGKTGRQSRRFEQASGSDEALAKTKQTCKRANVHSTQYTVHNPRSQPNPVSIPVLEAIASSWTFRWGHRKVKAEGEGGRGRRKGKFSISTGWVHRVEWRVGME